MRTHTESLNPAPLCAEVYADIKSFIFGNIDNWRDTATEIESEALNDYPDTQEYIGLGLTIACSENGNSWNFQTGDNSYTGGVYGLPHWAVTSIQPDSDPLEVYEDVIDQLEELLSW